MKPRSLLIPMIFAATAAIADTSAQLFESSDAQSQAAALLSGPHAFAASKAHSQGRTPSRATMTLDAQASAAALLGRPRAAGSGKASFSLNQSSGSTARVATRVDAQAQAAALLSGYRTTDAELRAQRTQRSARTSR